MAATDGDDDVSDSSVSSRHSSGSNGSKNNQNENVATSMPASPNRLPLRNDGPLQSQPHIVDYALSAVGDADGLRLLSRSPHPYHHRNTDLLHPADRLHAHITVVNDSVDAVDADTSHTRHNGRPAPLSSPGSALSLVSFASSFLKDSTPGSDSGTEADDEHFLKGLPAPRSKPHKGLRGMDEVLSGMSTPLLPVPQIRSSTSVQDSDQPRRTRSGHRRRAGKQGDGSGVDTDGGDSVAGSVYSVVGEDRDGKGCDGGAVAGGDGTQDRRPRGHGHRAISPQKLSQKLKRDILSASAALDSRDKDRRQGKGSAARSRRRREIARRSTELLLLVSLAALLFSNPDVRPLLFHWRYELQAVTAVLGGLLALYPLRLILWVRHYSKNDSDYEETSLRHLISIPVSFDPAPLFYPLAIPVLVSFLLATPTLHAAPLLNLVLSLCTIPRPLIPFSHSTELYNPLHWIISCVPMMVADVLPSPFKSRAFQSTLFSPVAPLCPNLATLIYPLHQTLCWVLHDLTTTSLLPAELQLTSVALINLLLLAHSPQAVILQALLWGGGVTVLVLGGNVVRRGILLARIPRWRFRREVLGSKDSDDLWWLLSPTAVLSRVWAELKSLKRARLELMYGPGEGRIYGDSDDSGDNSNHSRGGLSDGAAWKKKTVKRSATVSAKKPAPLDGNVDGLDGIAAGRPRRHSTTHAHSQPVTHTPSGRRKRATSPTIRAFFSLTHEQAVRRKWLYAGYLYACIGVVIIAGIRPYVAKYALHGREPFGWALGYLFGDIDWFRLEVVKANLENWICLPTRIAVDPSFPCTSCAAGWVEHVRQAWLGAANTRLALVGYWSIVLVFGLAVVFTLSPVYEVDTRRKVFHFMMVAMLLPATFVDPAYAALALSLVLAVFLLLDLLRASQLPPLSRPIATFLTPYVDGRDLRGPVVISHIFLLIGCAIPLWLSMASLPRVVDPLDMLDTPSSPSAGWEVPTRDVSMVAGVICVGLGDAAASLIGRRWGRRKWLWGGGKSLEGSFAFALVVFAGLMLASLWLRVGGWQATGEAVPSANVAAASPANADFSWLTVSPSLQRVASWIGFKAAQSVAPRAAVCATIASLKETVLTGGNDNVVVPVILWTCVKSFGL
ncbi:dolichol kinase [Sporothrix stenoceras]|uniref:dolichol kinase n=1 Tax=Sporothrix stenoceras TaxID=5173 RepID=A0ABR3ZUY9_9PEZI